MIGVALEAIRVKHRTRGSTTMGEIHDLNANAKRGRELTGDEKNNMAEGRSRSRVVNKYLLEIATGKYHRRGPRKTDPVAIKAELAELNAKLASAKGIDKLMLVEERRKLEQILAGRADNDAFDELEKEFIKIAKPFSNGRGISYESWREMGVPARVLIKAGIYPPNRGGTPTEDDQEE